MTKREGSAENTASSSSSTSNMELHLRKRKAGYERGSMRERYIHTRKCACVKITQNIRPNPKLRFLFTAALRNMVTQQSLNWWTTSYQNVGVSVNEVGLLFFPWSPPVIFEFVLEGKQLHSWSLETAKKQTTVNNKTFWFCQNYNWLHNACTLLY